MEKSEYLKLIRKVYEKTINEYHTISDKINFESIFSVIARSLIETQYESYQSTFELLTKSYLDSVKAISKLSPGLATGLYDSKEKIYLNTYNGKISDIPNDKKITEKTVFDSSSMTKMFTAVLLLKEEESENIDLMKPFSYYNPVLKKIDVSIYEALRFSINMQTDGRLDENDISKIERIRRLLSTKIYEKDTYIYSDIPYMLVPLLFGKSLEEGTENYIKKFYSFFRDELKLSNTGYSTIDMTGGPIEIDLLKSIPYYKKGIYDPKANIFETKLGIVSGHAGVTTTVEDLQKLFNHLSNGLLSKKSLSMITKKSNSKSRQRKTISHGMGVYINTGSLMTSDVPKICSETSFSAVGSTGTYSIFDLENGFNCTYLSNVRSGLYSKWINTENYEYGAGKDIIPKHHQVTIISGTGTIKDGRIIRPDGSFMPYVRATNNFKEESIETLLKLRIAKLILIEKLKLEYTNEHLISQLSDIEDTFNNKKYHKRLK